MGQPVGFTIQQAAATEVVHDQQSAFVCQFGHRTHRSGFGETCDQKIAGVNSEQEGSAFGECSFVVADACAVGGADFDQVAAALSHYVGDAKTPANLD